MEINTFQELFDCSKFEQVSILKLGFMEINTFQELFDCPNFEQVSILKLGFEETILYTCDIHKLILKCINLNVLHLEVTNYYDFGDLTELQQLTELKIILRTGINKFSGYSYSPTVLISKNKKNAIILTNDNTIDPHNNVRGITRQINELDIENLTIYAKNDYHIELCDNISSPIKNLKLFITIEGPFKLNTHKFSSNLPTTLQNLQIYFRNRINTKISEIKLPYDCTFTIKDI